MFGRVARGKITIFYGKMGSGKTTNAMAQVLDFHRRGLLVWVNFPVSKLPTPKGSVAPVWREDDPSGILSMRGGLYIIDEAYMTLNSREWANLKKEVFTAFTHVRKLDMTVVIIAQSWMRIDKSIREVSAYAREFKGSSLFGRAYGYVEYAIDEMGEIIKSEPVQYRSAMPGFSLIGRNVYDAFDTDYLFPQKASVEKVWTTAIIGSAAGGGASVQSASATHAPPVAASVKEERKLRGNISFFLSKLRPRARP